MRETLSVILIAHDEEQGRTRGGCQVHVPELALGREPGPAPEA